MSSTPSDCAIRLRPATAVDITFGRETHHAGYHDVVLCQFGEWNLEHQDAHFDRTWLVPDYEIILMNDRPVGYCKAQQKPDCLFLAELVIHPAHQNKGAGTSVMKALMAKAVKLGLPLRLQVLKLNKAQHLYRRLEFRDAGETDIHLLMEYNAQDTPGA